jgi:site-specific DNA recombinase
MRAVIYNRVSRDPKGEQRSVDEQDADNTAVCERNGWEIIGRYEDNDRSASRYAKRRREDWERLTEDLPNGIADVLVAWEISRTARDRLVWAELVEVCIRHDVRICVGGKLHDLDDPEDAFLLDLGSALAVRESGMTRKRVLRAVRANAEAGRPHGKLLYGYTREYDERGKLLRQIPREDQAAVIREAARRVVSGESCYSIAQDFNRRGLPAPRSTEWDLSKVKATLINPAYIGKRVHKGVIIGEAAWPAILDEATYYSAKARLLDPARRTRRDGSIKHELSGILLCDVCKNRLRIQNNRGYPAYMCTQCFGTSITKTTIENFVRAVVCERLSRPDAAKVFANGSDGKTVKAREEAQSLRERLDGFYDAAARGEVSPAALARIEAQLLPQIEAQEKLAEAAQVAPVLRQVLRIPNLWLRWPHIPLTVRRAVLREVVTIELLRGRKGARRFDPNRVRFIWHESGSEHAEQLTADQVQRLRRVLTPEVLAATDQAEDIDPFSFTSEDLETARRWPKDWREAEQDNA